MMRIIVSVIVMSCFLAVGCGRVRNVDSLQISGDEGKGTYSGYVHWNSTDGGFIKNGQWEYRHQNGLKSRSGFYRDGEMNGEWISWHDNGQCASLGSYNDGVPVGFWKFWDKQGSIVVSEFFLDDGEFGNNVAGVLM